jgi:hypothetical protein
MLGCPVQPLPAHLLGASVSYLPELRPLPVVPAPVIAEERTDFDAVAGHLRSRRRRHRTGLRRRLLPAAPAAAAATGRDAPDYERQEDDERDKRDAAPAPQLALALG